jgi:integrase/recombinase XerC
MIFRDENKFKLIDEIKKKKKAPYSLNQNKFLTQHEYENLEDLCRKHLDTKWGRDALLILIGLRTGARASEILALKKSDFISEIDSFLIKGIKGSSDREVPLPAWLAKSVRFYLKDLENEYLFPITYTRLYQIWVIYRPAKKGFHSLRHTFAIQAYTKTRDVRLVQRALGHRNIVNTMIYVDYVHDVNERRKLIWN